VKKLLLAMSVATALVVAAPAQAQEPALPKSPAKACALLAEADPELYGFIATKPGACQSTLAAVGLEALAAGGFPSTAAAVGNCRFLERETFPAYTPEDGRAYPYQFYWDLRILLGQLADADVPGAAEAAAYYDSIASQLFVRNRAGCVRVLRTLHPDGGIMGPVFAFLETLPPPQ
jgi:hypothetical protein